MQDKLVLVVEGIHELLLQLFGLHLESVLQFEDLLHLETLFDGEPVAGQYRLEVEFVGHDLFADFVFVAQVVVDVFGTEEH